MPKLPSNSLPSYRLHKQSGQAVVTLSGKDILLGRFDSQASREAYDQVTAEWLAAGRTLPAVVTAPLTVSELILRFWTHAQAYYRDGDGNASGELDNYRHAMAPLRRLYGRTAASEFGPLALKAVRQDMIRRGWCRNVVNRQTSRVRAVFRWASENELLPASVWHGLKSVSGIRRGRSEAKESKPVRPVADEHVNATLRFLPPHVRIMVQVQRITGMRSGELCGMRIRDIDRSSKVWTYRPGKHKTAHHDHERTIYIGPAAQRLLTSLIDGRKPEEYVFSPIQSEAQRRQLQRAQRRTPVQPSQVERSRRAKPRRLAARYDVRAYRRAILRASDLADMWAKGGMEIGNDERAVPQWHPHQLRHTASTAWRKQFGPEAALVLLGDRTTRMIDVYAEKDQRTAEEIMAAIG